MAIFYMATYSSRSIDINSSMLHMYAIDTGINIAILQYRHPMPPNPYGTIPYTCTYTCTVLTIWHNSMQARIQGSLFFLLAVPVLQYRYATDWLRARGKEHPGIAIACYAYRFFILQYCHMDCGTIRLYTGRSTRIQYVLEYVLGYRCPLVLQY